MKKFFIISILVLLCIISSIPFTYASSTTVISLSDSKITVNGETISTDTNSCVYLSNKMDNGGTSTDATSSNIEISNIININSAGTYEFSGTLTDGQISVNANNIVGEVRIVLNNVNITCKSAPAIFVYCKDTENEDCKVVIETASGSTNTIVGGKIKQSVESWEDQDSILYSIEKGYDDDRQYYERYKYDGSISSDISLTFDGSGTLNVTSSKKEGIESKMHITINGGTYNIQSSDDGINACTDNESIITINGGTVIVNILDDADEGDGIDSNGYIYINSGTVYAFAHPGSDNGLDSDSGTYINGGTVFTTGSMYEEAKTTNDTQIIQMNLSSGVNAGESIVIVDENNNVIFAFKADRKISTVVYSSSDLTGQTYSVYSGTNISGTVDDNNIYTSIESIDLSSMTKQENNTMNNRGPGRPEDFRNAETATSKSNMVIKYVIIGVLITIIVFIIGITIFSFTKKK